MNEDQRRIVENIKQGISTAIISGGGFGDEDMIEALEDIASHCTGFVEAKCEEMGRG